MYILSTELNLNHILVEGRLILKKFTKVLFIIIALIGVTSIADVQAEQPYKHLTYSDVTSSFQAFLTGGYIVNSLDNMVAAPEK